MSLATSYGFLILAVLLGVTSNSFAKSAEGFTLLFPSIITGITIVACMYALSIVMKNIPMGITYASFAGLTIIATIVMPVMILGKRRVKPSALFAKLFEAIPNEIPIAKNK